MIGEGYQIAFSFLADDGAQHELTANTLSFIKLYSSLLDDCLTIAWPDLEHGIAKVLYDVFDAQLKHIAASRDNNKFLSQVYQFVDY